MNASTVHSNTTRNSVFQPATLARHAILVYSPSVDSPPVATILSCDDRKTALETAENIAELMQYHIVKVLDLIHLTSTRVN